MSKDETQRARAKWTTRRAAGSGLFAALLLSASLNACSSDDGPAAKPVEYGDCGGRAEPLAVGMTVTSEQGYAFELSQFEPAVPVQSDGPPGNHWTVTITDPSGAKVTGATLAINTFMPDHMHPGKSSPGVETDEGSGVYDVLDLEFAMPTLFSVTLLLTCQVQEPGAKCGETLQNGEQQTASLKLCFEVTSG